MARSWRLTVASVLVGVAAGVGGVLLTLVLHLVQHVFFGYTEETFLRGVEQAGAARRVLAPALGGLLVGVGWWWHRRRVDGDALSVTRAVRDGSARLPVIDTVVDALLQVVAVGVGASLGREGAPRQTGAALAGWIGDRLGVTAGQRRTLLACGAGAGLAAVYDVPLAGAAFTLEILLVSMALRDLVPALVTSIVATVVAWPVLSAGPLYDVGSAGFAWPVLVWAALAGPVLGVLGAGFTRMMQWSRVHAPSGPRAAVGVPIAFAAIGALAIARPELLGNGKGLAEVAFAGAAATGTAGALGFLKPLATAMCLRGGAIGGLLTPSFATGAALGLCGGLLWSRLWAGGSALEYAMVGAAVMLAVTQRAAVTAVVLTVELTHTGLALLPAIVVAVGLGVVVARLLSGRTDRDTGAVPDRVIVVAAAILDAHGERVLAARRTAPPTAAGRWELPGGKVEPGELPDEALVREIGEELGCVVEVLEPLRGESPIGNTHTLRVATARISAGEPRPREHDALRWLAGDELDDVDWLEPDRPFLLQLRDVLATSPGGGRDRPARGIFFGEQDARSAAEQLRADGWSADVVRERYHGEDDDEDHPWAIVTDAPLLALELLVDEFDGWLDAPGEDAAERPDGSVAPDPIDLPSAPRRIKRPPA